MELGQVDIALECSLMSTCLALPREDHLRKVFQIFAYLKTKNNGELVFDPSRPDWWKDREGMFPKMDWKGTPYPQNEDCLKEEIPENAPEPRGNGMIVSAFVDSDHAGCKVTRRSRTGFLVYLQCALVYWFSKKQGSVETSTFGSEFIAMKQYTEYVRGLKYKLRMMGISCEGPCYIFGDNQSVLNNSSNPDSRLNKKSNSIAYNFVREGVARDEWRCTYVKSKNNQSDLLTKVITDGPKRSHHVQKILHWFKLKVQK